VVTRARSGARAIASLAVAFAAVAIVLSTYAIASLEPLALIALAILGTSGSIAAYLAWPRAAPPVELDAALSELEHKIEAAARKRGEMRTQAETAGRFREEFVAAVRHELKTPLNAIRGFTDVLLEEIDGPLNEQQREDVAAIRNAGQYLAELVESVLEEWAPDDRNTPIPLAPLDLEVLLNEVARLLKGQTIASGVALRVEIAKDVPKPLGDARRLRQILINLGTNAVRATSKGSVVLAAVHDPDGVRVTVRDTGRGIAPEDLPGLFEDFVQAGSSQERTGGSGLGLALTRDLVERHGGRIEVETAPGEGSAFHVILPLELD
jgi:signal transduction histidine kinase